MAESTTTLAHCNECSGERNHDVLHVEKVRYDEPEHGFWGIQEYEMLKCRGCGSVKIRYREWSSEDYDVQGQLTPRTVYYPPAVFRTEPKWLTDLSIEAGFDEGNIYDLLKEIYVALRNDQRTLAAMGIRALLERIMIEKVGDKGSFSENLISFEKAGYVSRLQRERLETILEAGHAAIHRLYKPSMEDSVTLVDIAESIVESLYIHGDKVDRLKKAIPPRAPKEAS